MSRHRLFFYYVLLLLNNKQKKFSSIFDCLRKKNVYLSISLSISSTATKQSRKIYHEILQLISNGNSRRGFLFLLLLFLSFSLCHSFFFCFFCGFLFFLLFLSRSFSVDATTQITFRFLSLPALSKTFTHSITSYTHRPLIQFAVHQNSILFDGESK